MNEQGGERSEPTPRNPLTWVLLGLVRAYQLVVSPWLPPTCRYYPSCSAYAVTSLRRHGVLKGTALATWRVLRCNPWSLGGVDHVPPRGAWPVRQGPPARRSDERNGTTDGTHGRRTLGDSTRGAQDSAPQDR